MALKIFHKNIFTDWSGEVLLTLMVSLVLYSRLIFMYWSQILNDQFDETQIKVVRY